MSPGGSRDGEIPPSPRMVGEGPPRGRNRRPKAALAVALVLASLVSGGCRDGSRRNAQLTVGTFWRGAAREALHRELLLIAHDLGNVTIEVRTISSTALGEWLTGGRSPQDRFDLAVVAHEWIAPLQQGGVIEELPTERAQVLRQKVMDKALLAAGDGDRVFGFPIGADVLALVYDPALFARAPETLEQILATPLRPGALPFAFDASKVRVLAPFVSSRQGGLLDDRGQLMWRPDAVADVYARLEPLWRMEGGWQACRGADLESLHLQLFAEGKLASFVAAPRLAPALVASGRPFSVTTLPRFADSDRPVRSLVTYDCAVVLRDSMWTDLAMEVGARLEMEGTNARLTRAAGRLPVLLGTRASEDGRPAPGDTGFGRALEADQVVPFAAHALDGLTRTEALLRQLCSAPDRPTEQQIREVFAGGAS